MKILQKVSGCYFFYSHCTVSLGNVFSLYGLAWDEGVVENAMLCGRRCPTENWTDAYITIKRRKRFQQNIFCRWDCDRRFRWIDRPRREAVCKCLGLGWQIGRLWDRQKTELSVKREVPIRPGRSVKRDAPLCASGICDLRPATDHY